MARPIMYAFRTGRGALLAAILVCLDSGVTVAASLPVRKSGLWEITTVAEGYGMKRFDTCIMPEDNIVPGIGDKDCTPPDIKWVSKDVIVNVTCKMQGGTQLTSMLISGDFKKWYRATSRITFEDPAGHQSRSGLSITAKYIGHCSAAGSTE